MPSNLIQQVFEQSKKVRTDVVFMTVGEIVNLYKAEEMVIKPVFQRLFRRDKSQKTNFIESLLLGIPTPSIFVAESEDWTWELIDWLQRISTILEFMWELRRDNMPLLSSNEISNWLISAEYLSELGWLVWNKMPQELQLKIKRSRFWINIILKDSDQSAKYEIFNRLNTWGSHLSNQEIRNTLLLQFNPDFYYFLMDLKEDENFQNVLNFSDKDIEKEVDTEFILRFFCVKNYNEGEDWQMQNVSRFLSKKMKSFYADGAFNFELEWRIFRETFELLNSSLWPSALKRYYPEKDAFIWRVMIPWFDTIAAGIGFNIGLGTLKIGDIAEFIQQLWSHDEFNSRIAVGQSVEAKLKFCEGFWKSFFKN